MSLKFDLCQLHISSLAIDGLVVVCVYTINLEVRGAAPPCNLSVWEPRFGGFAWNGEA